MSILLELTLDGIPPSGNRRTRVNKQTGTIYTDGAVAGWMDDVAFRVRRERRKEWTHGREMWVDVTVFTPRPHTFDLDNMLKCLMDAVMRGLSDAKTPPDHWVRSVKAAKQKRSWAAVTIIVYEEDDFEASMREKEDA